MLFLVYLVVLFTKGRRHKIDWIRELLKSSSNTLFGTTAGIIRAILRPWPFPAIDCAWSVPADIVLALFSNETDTFKHVGNIIYTPFLDIKRLHSFIEIQSLVRRLLELFYELFRKFDKSVLLAAPSTQAFAPGALIVEVLHFLHAKSPGYGPTELHMPTILVAAALIL